ncbi:hypothetical protein H6G36_23025 [Anabaena minutissima FACHB-250]|nr:hypothetical protein [Anabaena minutissima FACHB-250]
MTQHSARCSTPRYRSKRSYARRALQHSLLPTHHSALSTQHSALSTQNSFPNNRT